MDSKDLSIEDRLEVLGGALAKLIDEHKKLDVANSVSMAMIVDLAMRIGIPKGEFEKMVTENIKLVTKWADTGLDPDLVDQVAAGVVAELALAKARSESDVD